ncbi:MAG: hypothetical protein VX974_01825 [Pseudomonadota bacterium]|nr:hypothetical protein [Pseudomonadota bacterium]
MTRHIAPVAATLLALASPARAETILILHDTYDLPPPYFQQWFATPTEGPGLLPGAQEVFIRGDGKRGDFFGVLQLNCDTPEQSYWVHEGGFLTGNHVPAEAIRNLRKALC